MIRPENLPDYSDPPLVEVVTGVQFEPIANYTSVNAREIWELFREEFPDVEEHPPMEPKFETFGGVHANQIQFGFGPISFRGKMWFISKEKDHLIQFQPDRFLLNWRAKKDRQYPRYEAVAKSFEDNLRILAEHMEKHHKPLAINQVEVSYINIIPVHQFSDVGDWLSFFGQSVPNVENITSRFSEVVFDDNNLPIARMHYELNSAYNAKAKEDGKALQLTLTFRGNPSSNTIDSALDFSFKGREYIVNRFSELTTKQAHIKWGKK